MNFNPDNILPYLRRNFTAWDYIFIYFYTIFYIFIRFNFWYNGVCFVFFHFSQGYDVNFYWSVWFLKYHIVFIYLFIFILRQFSESSIIIYPFYAVFTLTLFYIFICKAFGIFYYLNIFGVKICKHLDFMDKYYIANAVNVIVGHFMLDADYVIWTHPTNDPERLLRYAFIDCILSNFYFRLWLFFSIAIFMPVEPVNTFAAFLGALPQLLNRIEPNAELAAELLYLFNMKYKMIGFKAIYYYIYWYWEIYMWTFIFMFIVLAIAIGMFLRYLFKK